MNRFIYLLFLVSVSVFVVSCDSEESDDSIPEQTDSILIDLAEDPEPMEIEIAPELVGLWKLEEMKMGANLMAVDIGESSLEFKDDGTLISDSDGVEPASFPYLYQNDQLVSDLWDEAQTITKLTANELILTEVVDGEQIHYIYKKQ